MVICLAVSLLLSLLLGTSISLFSFKVCVFLQPQKSSCIIYMIISSHPSPLLSFLDIGLLETVSISLIYLLKIPISVILLCP